MKIEELVGLLSEIKDINGNLDVKISTLNYPRRKDIGAVYIVEKQKTNKGTESFVYITNGYYRRINKLEEEEEMPNLIAFKGNKQDISMLLLSAERYALGRRTYIAGWTSDVIQANMGLLTSDDKQVMIRDIEQADWYGDEYEKVKWIELLEKLKGGE